MADQLYGFRPTPEQLQGMLDKLPKKLTAEERLKVWERNDAARKRGGHQSR